jgi:predicted dehydrogenase
MADKSVSTDSLALDTGTAEYTGDKFKIAVVGCGGIAQTHMKAYAKMPHVEVVAGCDIDPKAREHFSNTWGVEKTFENWNEMYEAVRPDGVNVCTPNYVHSEPVIDALNAGCHAMVEKPMAITPDECQKMVDAAEKSGKLLSVGFQFRFHPKTQYLKRMADQGTYGDLMYVRCQALRRRGIPNWGVFGHKDKQGGGPMIDLGVHILECAHYLMGSPKPVAAVGSTWTYHGDKPDDTLSHWAGWDPTTYTVEDLAVGHIRFENGAVLHIESSFVAHIAHDIWDINFMGKKGGFNWNKPAVFRDEARTLTNVEPSWLPNTGGFDDVHAAKQESWIDSCMNGTPQMATGVDGLMIQKMLDGVYRSADKGGSEVAID